MEGFGHTFNHSIVNHVSQHLEVHMAKATVQSFEIRCMLGGEGVLGLGRD